MPEKSKFPQMAKLCCYLHLVCSFPVAMKSSICLVCVRTASYASWVTTLTTLIPSSSALFLTFVTPGWHFLLTKRDIEVTLRTEKQIRSQSYLSSGYSGVYRGKSLGRCLVTTFSVALVSSTFTADAANIGAAVKPIFRSILPATRWERRKKLFSLYLLNHHYRLHK